MFVYQGVPSGKAEMMSCFCVRLQSSYQVSGYLGIFDQASGRKKNRRSSKCCVHVDVCVYLCVSTHVPNNYINIKSYVDIQIYMLYTWSKMVAIRLSCVSVHLAHSSEQL